MNNQKFLARVKYFGRAVTMDKQGRLLIPITLRNSAQMKVRWMYSIMWTTWKFGPCPVNEQSEERSITAQDEKTLSQVLSAPRLSRVIDWKNKDGHVLERNGDLACTAECMGIHASPEPRDSRRSNRSD